MSRNPQENLDKLQDRIGYRFKNIQLLRTALTHPSYANEQEDNIAHNERMEFLGDSILGAVISEMLYQKSDEPEGVLTNIKNHLVNAATLHKLADQLELGSHLLLGKGEEKSAGRSKESVLENAVEALVAAVFLDGGYAQAKKIVEQLYERKIDEFEPETLKRRDFKTFLQEQVQAVGLPPPEYEVIEASGPDHRKLFRVAVKLLGNPLAEGEGKSKKAAEQDAARALLQRIEAGDIDLSALTEKPQ